MADDPRVWPRETLEERRERLLRAVDDTGILSWTPQQRKALGRVVEDFLRSEEASQQTQRQRADAGRKLTIRLQIMMAVLGFLAVFGSFGGSWLASHTAPAPVVQIVPTLQPSPSPSPSASPKPSVTP